MAAPVSAAELKLCNSGQDEFFVAVAVKHFNTPHYSAQGWWSMSAGECWSAQLVGRDALALLVSYADAKGRVGAVPFDQKWRTSGAFTFMRNPFSYCLDPLNAFTLKRAMEAGTHCPEPMVRFQYPFYLSATQYDLPGRLDVAVDRATLHADHMVIPEFVKKVDPEAERYADTGRIDLVRGPTPLQIEAAEYEQLKLRMGLAKLALGGGSIRVDDLELDRCHGTEDDIFFCRYRLDMTIDAPAATKGMADILNFVSAFKGYYWSSFRVSDGRWRVVRQWDECTVTETRVRCSRVK